MGGVIGEWVERRGLMRHMGRGESGKGKAFEILTKSIEKNIKK